MMKALRFHGREDIRLDDVELPVCGPGQVRLKPRFVGICGTDLHEYQGGPQNTPTTPHPLTHETVPVTLGHEFSGTVIEVGEGVSDISVGDNVAVFPLLSDDTCGVCRDGFPNICVHGGSIGLTGSGGGMSQEIVVNRNQAYLLSPNISLEVGALIEPLSVAWHAVATSPFKRGDTALVVGAGPIGISVVLVLNALGASKIILSEVSPRRQEFAKQAGAHHVFNPIKDDVIKECKDLCKEVGPHVVFDAAGVQSGLDAALGAVRPGGTVVNIASWGQPATFNPTLLAVGEKRYIGVMTYFRKDFEAVIEAVAAGVLEPSSMITSKIKLAEVEEKGFKVLINEKDRDVKILVDVQV